MALQVSLWALTPAQQYSSDPKSKRCSHFQISYHLTVREKPKQHWGFQASRSTFQKSVIFMVLPCFLLNVTGPQVTCFDTFQTHAEFRFSPDFSKRYSFIVLAATSLSNQKMQEVPYTACFNSSMHDCNNIAHAKPRIWCL